MFLYEVFTFKERGTHGNAESLYLVRTRNYATVVVREHNNRFFFQSGIEDPFAGNVKIVAVNESTNLFHEEGGERLDAVDNVRYDTPYLKIHFIPNGNRFKVIVFREEVECILDLVHAFHRHFTINNGNNNFLMSGL